MTTRRTRKAAVTAAGTRGQRGSHGDGSPAGATPHIDAFDPWLRGMHGDIPGLRELIRGLVDFPFAEQVGALDTDRENDPTLPASQQIIDAEFNG
jgi:hypothetical protein